MNPNIAFEDKLHMGTILVLSVLFTAFIIIAPLAGPQAWNLPTGVSKFDNADWVLGIHTAGDFNEPDATLLRDSLNFLYDEMPYWYHQVGQAGPFEVRIDLEAGSRGVVAISTCCREDRYALVTFGHHLAEPPLPRLHAASSLPEQQAVGSQRIAFLSQLVHELEHVKALRTGRIGCGESERAALTKELEFKQALYRGVNSYSAAARRQISLEALKQQIKQQMERLESSTNAPDCSPV